MSAYMGRPYDGGGDIENLIDFARRCAGARFPGLTAWNPGDIAWQLGMWPAGVDFSDFVRVWEADGEVVALAIFEPPLNFEFDIDPQRGFDRELAAEVLAWVEERRKTLLGAEGDIPKAYQMLGEDTLSTTALDSDQEKVAYLQANGYAKVERHSVRYSRRLDADLVLPAAAEGYRLRHATDADIEARAELHRDAWSVWGPSSFSASRYRRLRASSLYDETLDVVAEAADGQLASYCIAWFDRANGVGHFEPVGTHPEHTGRGLGRAVVGEGLRRLQALGAHTALIGTASVNAPALRCYAATGFEFRERQHYYTKRMR